MKTPPLCIYSQLIIQVSSYVLFYCTHLLYCSSLGPVARQNLQYVFHFNTDISTQQCSQADQYRNQLQLETNQPSPGRLL